MFALLFPFICLAQCSEEEWYKINSAVPDGTVWGSSQNPLMVSFEENSEFYLVGEYYNSSGLILDGTAFTPDNCGNSNRGFVVQNLSIDGALQWYRGACFSFMGTVDGATMDDEGSLYVCGNFSGDLVFDGVLIGSEAVTSFFVLKLTTDGQLEWYHTGKKSAAVGASWTSEGLVLFLSISDSISFNGNTFYNESGSLTPDRDNVVLLTDSDGDVIWHQIMTGIDNPTIYATSFNDNIFVVQGRFDAELIYDGQTMTTNGFTLYQLAFNLSDGSIEWMKKSSGSSGVYSNVSVVFQDSLFASIGLYHENLNFQGNSISENGFGADGFVMMQRIDDGSVLWLNSFGGEREDAVYDVAVSPTGLGIMVCGMYASTTVNYQGVTLTNDAAEVPDPFILELDRDGKPTCTFMDIGSPANDVAVSVAVIGEEVFSVFSFRDSTSFGDVSIEATGVSDLAIWKTCLPCDTLSSITETTQTQAASLNIYPNPFSTQTQLNYRTAQGTQPTLQLTDMLGRVVQTIQLPSHEGIYTLEAATLGTGVYFCSLVSGAEVLATQKLVVSSKE